jgi:hypothetical protein
MREISTINNPGSPYASSHLQDVGGKTEETSEPGTGRGESLAGTTGEGRSVGGWGSTSNRSRVSNWGGLAGIDRCSASGAVRGNSGRNRIGDRAWAVGDRQSGGLGDGIGHIAVDDLSGTRAVRSVGSNNLGYVAGIRVGGI